MRMKPQILPGCIFAVQLLLEGLALGQSTTKPYLPQKDPQPVPSQPYERYTTTDKLGRQITFYLSEEPADAPPLPLVVYVQGSGCQSNFGRRNDRIIPQNGHATIGDIVRGKARLLIVEKVGVKFHDTPEYPGGSQGASEEFVREHTLDRWSEAVSAAVIAARSLTQIDSSKILVIGHSEGGLVACKVAADNPFVTHVATMAGGGPSQLFDLVELARQGDFAHAVSDDPEVRARYILSEYAKVLADPTSTTNQFMGHPYLRWSSFLATSPMEQLARTNARIYIAQGGVDKAVYPISARMLYAGLLAKGKDVTLDWVPNGDHGFSTSTDGKPSSQGWEPAMARVVGWYQGAAATPATQSVR